MRLTNEIRKEFASDVIANLPFKSKWDADKIVAEIDKRLKSAQPADVIAFAKKYPDRINMRSVALDFMTHEVESIDRYCHWKYYKAHCIAGVGLDDIQIDDLKAAWELYRKELADRHELQVRLRSQAYSVNTLAELKVLFPDLVKFMPKEPIKISKQLPVPAVGLTDELVKLGLNVSDKV